MYHDSERLTRRTFNERLITLALLGYLGYEASKYLVKSPENTTPKITEISQLRSFERSYLNPPNKNLIGTLVNIPFAPYYSNPELVQSIVKNMTAMNSKIARIYVPNEFEQPTGTYHFEYLSRLSSFISDLNRYSDGAIKCVVVIDDTYNLLHSDKKNSSYGSRPLNHHALKGSIIPEEIKQYQQDYFTKQSSAEEYIQRALVIIEVLAPISEHIVAWEVANEPEIPFATNDKVGVLTQWYSWTALGIRSADYDKPLISGLKNPMLIDAAHLMSFGLDHNSAHIYENGSEQFGVTEYINQMVDNAALPPLVVSETGFTRNYHQWRLPRMFHDWQMARMLQDLVLRNILIDEEKKEAKFPVANFGVWQLDTGDVSHDGFQFDPQRYPHMAKLMKELEAVLSFE